MWLARNTFQLFKEGTDLFSGFVPWPAETEDAVATWECFSSSGFNPKGCSVLLSYSMSLQTRQTLIEAQGSSVSCFSKEDRDYNTAGMGLCTEGSRGTLHVTFKNPILMKISLTGRVKPQKYRLEVKATASVLWPRLCSRTLEPTSANAWKLCSNLH